MATVNMHKKFEIDIPKQTWLTLWNTPPPPLNFSVRFALTYDTYNKNDHAILRAYCTWKAVVWFYVHAIGICNDFNNVSFFNCILILFHWWASCPTGCTTLCYCLISQQTIGLKINKYAYHDRFVSFRRLNENGCIAKYRWRVRTFCTVYHQNNYTITLHIWLFAAKLHM